MFGFDLAVLCELVNGGWEEGGKGEIGCGATAEMLGAPLSTTDRSDHSADRCHLVAGQWLNVAANVLCHGQE